MFQAIFFGAEQHGQVHRCSEMGVRVPQGDDPRWVGQVSLPGDREGLGTHGRYRSYPQGDRDRCGDALSACGQRDGHQVARGTDTGSRMRLCELHTGFHRFVVNRIGRNALRNVACRSLATISNHAGGRHHCAQSADAPLRERGVRVGTHQPAECGRQQRFEHVRTERLESKKISKTNSVTSQLDYDMVIQEHSYWSVVDWCSSGWMTAGLHPHGGPHVRRCAAEHGDQT